RLSAAPLRHRRPGRHAVCAARLCRRAVAEPAPGIGRRGGWDPPVSDTGPPNPAAGAPPRRGNRRVIQILRWAVLAAAVLVLLRVVRQADIEHAWSLLRRLGWPFAFVALPSLLAMMLDSAGWRAILSTLGHPVPWRRLLGLRLSVEAIVLALPGG